MKIWQLEIISDLSELYGEPSCIVSPEKGTIAYIWADPNGMKARFIPQDNRLFVYDRTTKENVYFPNTGRLSAQIVRFRHGMESSHWDESGKPISVQKHLKGEK